MGINAFIKYFYVYLNYKIDNHRERGGNGDNVYRDDVLSFIFIQNIIILNILKIDDGGRIQELK